MRPSRTPLLWVGLLLGLLVSFALDAPVHAIIASARACAPAQTIGHAIRWVGEGQVQVTALLLLVLIGALMSRRVRAAGAWGLVALAISGAAAGVLKVLIHRPRPWVTAPEPHSLTAWVSTAGFQSFPSGESATAFAVAALLGYRFPSLRVPLLVGASLVAAARVVVGAHALSDVWAGAMLGLAVGRLAEGWAARSAARAGADAPRTRRPRLRVRGLPSRVTAGTESQRSEAG
jgi:membrane-associated phospholipid phosphatase